MLIKDIIRLANKKLIDEQYSYAELEPYLDDAIDAINRELNSIYPAFSEAPGASDYNYFPARYIRTVVVPGAVYHRYLTDDGGVAEATGIYQQFMEGMFYMVRDYHAIVPTEYQDSTRMGTIAYSGEPATRAEEDNKPYNINFGGLL